MSSSKSYEKLEEKQSSEDNDSSTPPLEKDSENTKEPEGSLAKFKKKFTVCKTDGFKIIVGGCIIFSTALTIALIVDIYTKDPPKGHGAVSSDSRICSKMGTDVLAQKGSAVDAAVAVAFCLAVVRFSSTGLNSGGYILIHAPNGVDEILDFQFVAPAAASQNMFKGDKSLAEKGGLSFAVPGFVKGLYKAHSTHGLKPWKDIISMSAKLAEDGFIVDEYTAKKISSEFHALSKDLKKILAPGNVPLKEGAKIQFPGLAKILNSIADRGPDAFYKDNVPKEIIKKLNSTGNIVTEDDFNKYQTVSQKPIKAAYDGVKIITSPAPSSGPIALLAMNILHELKITKADKFSVKNYQYLAEVFKFSFAYRTLLGDPKFLQTDITDEILKKEFSKKIADLVKSNETFDPSYYGPNLQQPKTKGTASAVVLGTNGDLVSVVSSIGSPFGSKDITESGLILNNGMGSFSSPGFSNIYDLEPSKANYIRPGKRPLSAACPMLVFKTEKPCNNHYILSAGDNVKAITSTIQVLWNLLKFDDDVPAAVESPRIHHQLQPNVLRAEGHKFRKAFINSTLDKLVKLGHKVDSSVENLGSVNVAGKKDSNILTYADSRTEGSAVKF